MTARFQALDVVRGAAIPIHVVNGAAERIGGTSRRFRFHDSDFESLAGAGDDRLEGGEGDARSKIRALEAMGVAVASRPSEIPALVRQFL